MSLTPSRLMYFFAGFFLNLTRFWTKLRVLVLCFPDFTKNSNISSKSSGGGVVSGATHYLKQTWYNIWTTC
jgi:hypothetical protein